MKNVINEHKIPFEIREPQAAYNAKNMAFLKESAEELNSGKVVVKLWKNWSPWKMSKIAFSEKAWADYLYWQSQDKKTL